MHTQCSQEYLLRLPASSSAEVKVRENVEQHQKLLHENWFCYAKRRGLLQSVAHLKNVTETWDDFHTRKQKQQTFFELRNRLVEGESVRQSERNNSSRMQSSAVIDKMMTFDRRRLNKRLPPQNTLYIDFVMYEQRRLREQREAVELAESLLRGKILEDYDELLFSTVSKWHADYELLNLLESERAQQERTRAWQRELELRHMAEAEKEREAARLEKAKQDAEAEKERVEMEKRLERKRREEERRAKARLERVRRKTPNMTSQE